MSVYRKSGYKSKIRQNLPLFSMFLPVLMFYLIFKYAPMFGTVIAFKDYNLADGYLHSPWVGMKNFQMLFTHHRTVQIIRNSLILGILSIAANFPFPIMLAILLNELRKMWFKKAVQTIVYLPHFFSWVIVGGLVITLFSQDSGLINHWVKQATGDVYPFLYKPFSWVAIFLGSGVWKESGFSAIIYLAALTTIDPHQYEAACIDGANKWRQMWHITLPGIRSTIILLLIISSGSIMEVGFDQVYVLQNPIVSDIGEVISTYSYRIGLQGAQYSLISALGFFESIVACTLLLLTNWIARKFNQGLW